MEQTRLSDNISPVFYNYCGNLDIYNIATGGRACFKSTTNAIMMAMLMIKGKRDVVVIRENYSDHKDTSFNELLNAFKLLKVDLQEGIHYPYGHKLYIRLPNGSRARFYGNISLGYENLKGIRPTPGNFIAAVWFFEITQFKSAFGMQQVISSFIRGQKDEFYIFIEYNTPEQRGHWVFDYIDRLKERGDVNYIFTVYKDHPLELQKKWIGEIALREIEALRIIDEDQHLNIYMGECVALGGRIYKKFNRALHTIELDNYDMRSFIPITFVGIDPGYTDKFVVTATMLGKNYERVLFKETLVIDNKKKELRDSTGGIKRGVELDPNECMAEAFRFFGRLYEKYKQQIVVFIDSADKGLRMMFENYIKAYNVSYVGIKNLQKVKKFEKSDNSLQERIRFGNILIGADVLRINKKCVDLVNAFEDAIFGKNNDRKDTGSTTFNDSLDSAEYSVLEYLRNIQEIVLYNKSREVTI